MNGIEYSALANVIGQRWQQQNGAAKKPAPVASKTPPVQSINSVNSDFQTSSIVVPPDEEGLAQTSALRHRLQSMVEPPDYLMPSLIYRNTAANTVKRGEKSMRRDYTDDFILISEFSEIEGPRPLLTIPTDGATGFNKNEYSLHLMCVDFHSHLNTGQTTASSPSDGLNDSVNSPTSTSSKFGLTKDTSIINYWDLNARMVSACVQHFNLYDLEARGLV